jgi:hypothetical protein
MGSVARVAWATPTSSQTGADPATPARPQRIAAKRLSPGGYRDRDARANVGADVKRGLGLRDVADLAASRMEVERITLKVGLEVDFGQEAAAR